MNDKKNPPPDADASRDAPLKEILLYAFGNIEGGFANQFVNLIQQLLIVVMFVNPLIIGLIIAIKTAWDGITDPIMAYITDNTRSRWGRRIPYILFGGVSRMILLVLIVLWLPKTKTLQSNEYLETDQFIGQMTENIRRAQINIMAMYRPGSIEPVERMNFKKFVNRIILRQQPDEEEILRESFGEAEETIASITNRMPHMLAVLQTNLQQKTAWLAEVDESTEQAQQFKEKREQLVQEVRTRMDKAENLLSRAQKLALLREAAEAREAGRLDAALRAQADAAAEQIKRVQADPIAERMPGIIDRWNNEQQRLLALGEDEKPRGRKRQRQLDNAALQIETAEELLAKARDIRRRSETVLEQIASGSTNYTAVAMADVTELAERASRMNPPVKPKPRKGPFAKITEGWKAFQDPANADQKKIAVFMLIGMILFTTFTTIQSVPYFALGIELCPSYDGRTRVVVYRSIVDKALGLIRLWIPTFCFMAIFANAFDGLLVATVSIAALGIFSTILMAIFIRERTRISRKKKPMNLFKSIITIMSSSYFWRVFLLYQVIGITWGIFMQFGFFLNIYWVMGSAFKGAWLTSIVQSLAWGLGFISLPLINWGCKRYQKHNVVRVAVILMCFGSILQWFTISPKYPYLQLIMPFFTSVGIGTFYVVMGSLLADVTDADELKHGERREGMFGASMSFIGKIIGSLTPILAGAMLVVSGFDAALEYNQTASTILNMRLLYSIVPGCFMLFALFLLHRYPLNREKMNEIKAELKRRHDIEEAAGLETASAPDAETAV